MSTFSAFCRRLTAPTVSLLLLVVAAIGIVVFYSDYIYNPNTGYTYFYTEPMTSEEYAFWLNALSGTSIKIDDMKKMTKEAEQLADEIDAWARDNKATIFLAGGYPHVAFAAYSKKADDLIFRKLSNCESGLYVSQDIMNNGYLVQDGFFLPVQFHKEIEGIFNRSSLPKALQTEGLYLMALDKIKFSYLSIFQTRVFTDAKDLSGLFEIMEDHHFRYVQLREYDNLQNGINKAFTPMTVDKTALLLAILGSFTGFVYLVLADALNGNERIRIHYIFGCSVLKTTVFTLMKGMTVCLIAIGISMFIIPLLGTYLSVSDVRRIRHITIVIQLSLTVFAYGISSVLQSQMLRRRIR